MGPLDALWHLLNFLAPAVAVGLMSAALAKLVWRRELRSAGFWRLGAWASAAGGIALTAALLAFGRDGKMASYGFMILACALGLWWAGLRGARG